MSWSVRALLVGAFLISPARADVVDDLAPGSWVEIPDSSIRPHMPNPLPYNWGGADGLFSWSGAAYDTSRDLFLVFGGGHCDYSGNEVYAFDMGTLSWSRHWGPGDTPDSCTGTNPEYPDGTPGSRHTYDGLEYLPNVDRMWIYGGSVWGSGNASADTWQLDLDLGSWERGTDNPEHYCSLQHAATYDPDSGHVFIAESDYGFFEYDPIGDAWTRRGDEGTDWTSMVATTDTLRHRMIAVGENGVYAWDLDTYVRTVLTTTGATEITGDGERPGFEYVEARDELVAWNGGASVYTLDPDSNVWTRHDGAGSPPPMEVGTGTYSRFRYVPSRDVFVAITDVDENVFVYRPASSDGTPPDTGDDPVPDTTPPARPTSLRVV